MTTILIVDDEPPIVDLVRFTLEDADVRVVEASDGAAALDLARRIRPDLVLLDVHMPRLNGLEVCRQLRRVPDCAHTHRHAHRGGAGGRPPPRARGRRRRVPDQALLAAGAPGPRRSARAGDLGLAADVALSQALAYARDLKTLYEVIAGARARDRAGAREASRRLPAIAELRRRSQEDAPAASAVHLPEPARPGQCARGQGRLHARALRARRGAGAAARARGGPGARGRRHHRALRAAPRSGQDRGPGADPEQARPAQRRGMGRHAAASAHRRADRGAARVLRRWRPDRAPPPRAPGRQRLSRRAARRD